MKKNMVFKGTIGDSIEEVAKEMVALAKENDSKVETTFNGILLTVSKYNTEGDVVGDFHLAWERSLENYKKTPQYAEQKRREEQETISKQEKINIAIDGLDVLDFNNLCDVINWFESIQDATDCVFVSVPCEFILETFNKHGFIEGVNCGDDYHGEDEENSARWLIGQALANLSHVGAIHPMIVNFAKDWRDRFINV